MELLQLLIGFIRDLLGIKKYTGSVCVHGKNIPTTAIEIVDTYEDILGRRVLVFRYEGTIRESHLVV